MRTMSLGACRAILRRHPAARMCACAHVRMCALAQAATARGCCTDIPECRRRTRNHSSRSCTDSRNSRPPPSSMMWSRLFDNWSPHGTPPPPPKQSERERHAGANGVGREAGVGVMKQTRLGRCQTPPRPGAKAAASLQHCPPLAHTSVLFQARAHTTRCSSAPVPPDRRAFCRGVYGRTWGLSAACPFLDPTPRCHLRAGSTLHSACRCSRVCRASHKSARIQGRATYGGHTRSPERAGGRSGGRARARGD